mmetsp:Transcript_30475/g.79312  ORF Transcript_30475/g.79312 Transcript_30475/m.79312 type:complete len:238 (+) Transcript_30475:1232-1945(+)
MVWCKCLGGRTWSSLQLTMPPRLTQWREATKHLQALRDTLKERAMQIRRAVMGAAVEKGHARMCPSPVPPATGHKNKNLIRHLRVWGWALKAPQEVLMPVSAPQSSPSLNFLQDKHLNLNLLGCPLQFCLSLDFQLKLQGMDPSALLLYRMTINQQGVAVPGSRSRQCLPRLKSASRCLHHLGPLLCAPRAASCPPGQGGCRMESHSGPPACGPQVACSLRRCNWGNGPQGLSRPRV